MKRNRRNLLIAFIVLLSSALVILVSCVQKEKDCDSMTIESGKQALNAIGIVPNRIYEVTYEKGIYKANINGDIQLVKLPEKTSDDIEVKAIEDINNKEITDIFDSSKTKVLQYVNDSTIISEKKEIAEKFEQLQIKLADLGEDTPALYKNNVIYIDKGYKTDISEWMICHEMIHFISDITNGGVENEAYGYFLFNEVLTDIITRSLSPDSGENLSGYLQYYDIVLPYIGIFQEDAIRAYYYGYSDLWQKVGKDEFDFWVYSLENYDSNDIAMICANNFLNKWAESSSN